MKHGGWLEPAAYHDYLTAKSEFRVTLRLDPAYTEAQPFQWRETSRLYHVSGAQLLTELVKYGAVMLVVGVSLSSAWRAGQRPVAWSQPPLLALSVLVVLAALISWARFGGLL